MKPAFIIRYLICCGLFLFGVVHAQSATPTAKVPFGAVFHLQGGLTATDATGVVRVLQKGDTVYVGETLATAQSAEAVIKTRDAGIVALRPNTRMTIQQFAAQAAKTDGQVVALLSGSLRLISGWIGLVNRDANRVLTPSATIGIRGTDYEPWVLLQTTPDGKYRPGTYNKVNSGQTVLEAMGSAVVVEPGKVGFVRDKADSKRMRAILTLLLPQILDKVPDFYVPGAFDAELEHYSAVASEQAKSALLQANPSSAQWLDVDPAPQPPAPVADGSDAAKPVTPSISACQVAGIDWLHQLDAALAQRDAQAVLNLFASDVQVTATIRAAGQTRTLSFQREEMVQSTLQSIARLQNYQHQREATLVRVLESDAAGQCRTLQVESVAIDQGFLSQQPFRFIARERYKLELRANQWLATLVHTEQQ
jgi:hypothetical protein